MLLTCAWKQTSCKGIARWILACRKLIINANSILLYPFTWKTQHRYNPVWREREYPLNRSTCALSSYRCLYTYRFCLIPGRRKGMHIISNKITRWNFSLCVHVQFKQTRERERYIHNMYTTRFDYIYSSNDMNDDNHLVPWKSRCVLATRSRL